MQVMSEGEEDQEIKGLQTTLDKLLDLQHPERVRERLKEKSLANRGEVLPVSRFCKTASASLLSCKKEDPSGHFYSTEQPRLSKHCPLS